MSYACSMQPTTADLENVVPLAVLGWVPNVKGDATETSKAACTRHEPYNITPMAVNSISFGSPHVRPMGRTCGEPNEIKKYPPEKHYHSFSCAGKDMCRNTDGCVKFFHENGNDGRVGRGCRALLKASLSDAAATAKLCAMRCNGDPDCIAFSWDEGSQKCYTMFGKEYGIAACTDGGSCPDAGEGTRPEPFNITPMAVNSISFGSPYVRPIGCIVRVVPARLTKSRKIPTRKISPAPFREQACGRCSTPPSPQEYFPVRTFTRSL